MLFSDNTQHSGLISIERDVNNKVFDVGSRNRIDLTRRIIASTLTHIGSPEYYHKMYPYHRNIFTANFISGIYAKVRNGRQCKHQLKIDTKSSLMQIYLAKPDLLIV